MQYNDALTMKDVRSASQISKNIVERLTMEIPESEIIAGIREMMNASYVTKSGKEHPDYRAREAGIKLYLAYTVGLPLQRQIIASVSHETDSDDRTWERLMASPTARKLLRQRLINAGEEF